MRTQKDQLEENYSNLKLNNLEEQEKYSKDNEFMHSSTNDKILIENIHEATEFNSKQSFSEIDSSEFKIHDEISIVKSVNTTDVENLKEDIVSIELANEYSNQDLNTNKETRIDEVKFCSDLLQTESKFTEVKNINEVSIDDTLESVLEFNSNQSNPQVESDQLEIKDKS